MPILSQELSPSSSPQSQIPENLRHLSCDGSCLKNPGGALGWAAVDGQGNLAAGGSLPPGSEGRTSNIAELRALHAAIILLPAGHCNGCLIESDSTYAINAITQGYEPAKLRGWKTAERKPLANLKLIQEVRAQLELRPGLQILHVKSHSDNWLNDLADSHASTFALAANKT